MSASAEMMVRDAAALSRAGKVREAIESYERVLALWPGLPNCWYSLGFLQRQTGAFSSALLSYQRALDFGVTRPEEVHLNRGVIYADCLHQYEAAEAEIHKALALNPEFVPALINLANLHEDLGRRQEAIDVYERVLTLDPDCALALSRYASVKPISGLEDPLIGQLRDALSRRTDAAERADLGFALGRVLDACGSHDAAFDAYAAANHDSRASVPSGSAHYDRAGAERFIDRLIASHPQAARSLAARPAAPAPIFVCGMFRSGSTLMEQLLARHPRVTAGGELELLPRIVQERLVPFPESMGAATPELLESLRQDYLDGLARLFPGAKLVTDKRPDNFMLIGLIKTLFPDAKIVHTVREPLDNCLSIFFLHLDQRMSYALDLMDTAHHYRQYVRVMAHWKSLYGTDILDVSYDAFVREPEPLAQQLFGSLGLEWDPSWLELPDAESIIKTASVWQARKPLYRSSSGRACHYEQQLLRVREFLGT